MQNYRTAKAVAFFKGEIGKVTINQITTKLPVWEAYYDDFFCLLSTTKYKIEEFVRQANIQTCAAEISASEIIFLNTKLYKGERFNREWTLDMQTH